MWPRTLVCTACVWLVLMLCTLSSFSAPAKKLPSLNVTKTKIVFDPRICKPGASGGVHTGCEGVVVHIIGREKGKCLFRYITDACGGVHSHYRGEVSIHSGPVTIEVFNGGIKNSFPRKNLKLIRSTGPLVTVLVEGTDQYVSYLYHERRSEMTPRKGGKVKFRFLVYKGRPFKTLLSGARHDGFVEFAVGTGKGWPWLETAMEYMTVGDRRKVMVPAKIAPNIKRWLPKDAHLRTLYVEIRLVSLERVKEHQ